MLMVASPVIGSFCAWRYTSSKTFVKIFQIPADAVVTVLNCLVSAECWSRTGLSSATVAHAEVLATLPGYIGYTK